MQCQNCKAQLADKVKFCPKCGAKVNVRLCPNGHVIEPDEIECRYCPASAGTGTKSISVSTTIDKSTVIEKPVGKTTEGEVIPRNIPDKTSIFSDAPNSRKDAPELSTLFGWLVVTEGKDLWKTFPVIKPKISIGRSSDCDIIIDDEHISAKHASMKLQNNVLFITDLDSGNGTYVNTQEITRCELSDNDIIKMGKIILKIICE